jgi:hypothetical protein
VISGSLRSWLPTAPKRKEIRQEFVAKKEKEEEQAGGKDSGDGAGVVFYIRFKQTMSADPRVYSVRIDAGQQGSTKGSRVAGWKTLAAKYR